MSDASQGEGWWRASDGKWYSPEQHPDYKPAPPPMAPDVIASPEQSPPLSTGAADLAGTATPWWRRWWVFALALVAVLAVVAGVLTSGDDDGDTAADDATSTTSGATDEATTSTIDAEATSSTSEVESETTTTATASSPPAASDEECRYVGLDSFDDMQVELTFVNPLSSPGDLTVTYALFDGDGVRFLSSTAFIDDARPQERFRIQDDTVEEIPARITDENSITCRILETEDFGFGETPTVPDDASCSFVGLDFADDIQVELMVSNPFAETTDLAVTYALRGADGVRFADSTAFIDVVGSGEVVRIEDDSVSEFPEWVDQSEFTCDILGVEDFGF